MGPTVPLRDMHTDRKVSVTQASFEQLCQYPGCDNLVMKEAWIVNVDGRGWCHIMHLADLIMTLGGHRPDGPAVRHVTVWTGWSDQPTEAHERALADAERDGLTLSAVLPIGNSHAVYVFVGREP